MRYGNKWISAAAGAALILALAACGSKEASPPAPSAASAQPAASQAPAAQTSASAEAATPAVSASATEAPSPSASPAQSASAQPSATAAASRAPQASVVPTPTSAQTASPAPQAAAGPVSAEASNFKWTLSQTEFKAGTPIRFAATSRQGVHGFSIVGTSVNVTVRTGETQDITWTPDKPGEYTIKCSLFCGTGHSQMETTIIVK